MMEREQYEMFAALTETLNENNNLVIRGLSRIEALLVKLEKAMSKDVHEHEAPVMGRSEGFEGFWDAYPRSPRKINKAGALAIWKRQQIAPAHVDKVMQALAFDKSSEQWKDNNGQYIPLVTTWLNRKRYLDDLHDSKQRPAVLDELDAVSAHYGGANGVPQTPPNV